jgi:hypothetical protein
MVYDDHTKFHENPSVKTLMRKTRLHKPVFTHREPIIFKRGSSNERFKRFTYLTTLSVSKTDRA